MAGLLTNDVAFFCIAAEDQSLLVPTDVLGKMMKCEVSERLQCLTLRTLLSREKFSPLAWAREPDMLLPWPLLRT